MLWVAVILGIIVIALTVVAIAVIAVASLQKSARVSQQFIDAHRATLQTLEAVHQRNLAQNSSVLDRFMALDFSLFKAYQSSEDADEGDFLDPEAEGDMRVYSPSGDSFARAGADIEERLRAAAEERALLAEDFGEMFEKEEGLRA